MPLAVHLDTSKYISAKFDSAACLSLAFRNLLLQAIDEVGITFFRRLVWFQMKENFGQDGSLSAAEWNRQLFNILVPQDSEAQDLRLQSRFSEVYQRAKILSDHTGMSMQDCETVPLCLG